MKKNIGETKRKNMRKNRVLFILLLLVFGVQVNYQASEIEPATIITVPLDSRPVSVEYLQDLIYLGEDEFISSDKSNLDLFTEGTLGINKFASSKSIRTNLKNMVSSHNKENATVIINTSSYITGGLVGSRCYNNYQGYRDALNDLRELTTAYKAPYYYVNATMPRTLPIDRNNKFWPNDTSVKGLAYFYLQDNEEAENKTFIENQFAIETPMQLLMEWSYVQSKAKEHGFDNLTKWESDFLEYFNNTYISDQEYARYAYEYEMVYKNATEIIKSLMSMNKQGYIDELVISVDDFQLPRFIAYINKTSSDTSWIHHENGNPIKYSFARYYLEIDSNSVYSYHQSLGTKENFNKSLHALASDINYLYGTDEVPQVIYARDLVRRTKLTTFFMPINYEYNLYPALSRNNIGPYDSITTQELFDNTMNFVSRTYDKNIRRTKRPFKLYVNQYLQGKVNLNKSNTDKLIKNMFYDYDHGSNIGLIELYSFEMLDHENNELFQSLSNRAYLASLGLQEHSVMQLGCYSSWNTVSNAVGLGVAHAQVFGIMEELTTNEKQIAIRHSKILARHLLEDGVYAVKLKSKFSNTKYDVSSNSSMLVENTLLKELNDSNVLSNFLNTDIRVGNESVRIKNYNLAKAGFPWLRAYECYIDIALEAQ